MCMYVRMHACMNMYACILLCMYVWINLICYYEPRHAWSCIHSKIDIDLTFRYPVLVLQLTFPCAGCSSECGRLTASSGTVSDGPSNYLDLANCRWLIAPSNGESIIRITFTEFNTEGCCDFVRVSSCTDANCGTRTELFKGSGPFIPSPSSYISTTGFLLVEFTTDGSVTRQGFTATYTTLVSEPRSFLPVVLILTAKRPRFPFTYGLKDFAKDGHLEMRNATDVTHACTKPKHLHAWVYTYIHA